MKISWLKWNPQKYNPFGDKWSRCAAGRLLAFGGGIVASSYLTHRYVSKKLEADYEEQLESVKQYYRKPPPMVVDEEDLEIDFNVVKWKGDDGTVFSTYDPEIVEPENPPGENLKQTLQEYGDKQFTAAEEVKPSRRPERPSHKVQASIRLLSEEEFMVDDVDGTHEKSSLLYYEEDDTLVDPFDAVIESYNNTVGVDWLSWFEREPMRETVHVRNTAMYADYEIEIIRGGSYSRDLLGVSPDDFAKKDD